MILNGKLESPITIKIGDNENITLEDGEGKSTPLNQDIKFEEEHYGFVIVVDSNGNERKVVYPTQCSIQKVSFEGEKLKVYENDKKAPWSFDKKGRIETSATDEFTDEALSEANIVVSDAKPHIDKPLLLNPVRMFISERPEKSVVMRDNPDDCDYPLYPGAMLGGTHYGFIIMQVEDDDMKEVAYPTRNRIEAVGIEGNHEGDLKVFEEGKFHPWVFTFKGNLKAVSSYNEYSRKDIEYIRETYGIEAGEEGFQFKKKKDK